MTTIAVPQAINALLALCATENQVRFGGTIGVRVEVKDKLQKLIATDGRILGVLSQPHKDNRETSVTLPKGGFPCAPIASGDVLEIRKKDSIDGRFPDYNAIMPKKKPLASIIVDVTKLAQLLAVVKAMEADHDACTLEIFPDMIRVTCEEGGEKFTGLCMRLLRRGKGE